MSNDTDTSSSSGSKKHKRKSEKKHKKQKKEKKEKRHKHKKRSRRDDAAGDSDATKILSIAPPRTIEENIPTTDVDAFGPALPPHLLQSKREGETEQKPVIGPTIPSNFKEHLALKPQELMEDAVAAAASSDDEDINAGTYGPMPVPSGANAELKMSTAQIELEQRALELKLAAIGGSDNKDDQTVREEWMLELPQVGLKSGLAALSNLKRTFHQGKERPDFSDRSIWTKTPQDAENPQVASTSKTTAATLKNDAEAMYERKRDEEQESIAKRHKKKHKRDESLVDIHQKKLRKEQKKRERELAASGEKPERRPFSRDVDLKMNKIDKNQTKQIVDKAKILNTKFSTGHAKYL